MKLSDLITAGHPGQPPVEHEVLQKMIAELQETIKELSSQNSFLVSRNSDLAAENESLKEQLALLRARRFGKSSEKLDKQIEELELKIEENESVLGFKPGAGRSVEEGTCEQSKARPKRKKLPEHLARETVILEPDAKCPECGGEKFRKIGEDVSETLEYVPASFKVIRYVRPRCACVDCERILQAYPASKAIDKGKAGSGLLAHIIVQKYCNHLPLYRQSQMYAREDMELPRTTMAGWVGQCIKLLEPIAKEIQKHIFASAQIHGDDTPIKVLAPGLGKTKTGRLWTYVVDGRPHGETRPPAVCYFYSPDRKGIRPAEHLKDFTGVLHADAYSGYDKIYLDSEGKQTAIEEAGCWSHMRRKFYEVTVANDKANIAYAVLEQISGIYEIEAEIKGSSPEQRLQERQSRSKGLVEELFAGFRKAIAVLPQKSSTGKAISYALNNREALMRFLYNGRIEIDNNAAERAMRAVALGRKNWLFAGSDGGGHNAAVIYTIVETAKLNNINPWKYLKKVFDVIQDYKANKLAELLPWNIILE